MRSRTQRGKSVGQQGWDLASTKGEGAGRYRWINPVNRQLEPKITFFAKAGNDACGVGAYNPE